MRSYYKYSFFIIFSIFLTACIKEPQKVVYYESGISKYDKISFVYEDKKSKKVVKEFFINDYPFSKTFNDCANRGVEVKTKFEQKSFDACMSDFTLNLSQKQSLYFTGSINLFVGISNYSIMGEKSVLFDKISLGSISSIKNYLDIDGIEMRGIPIYEGENINEHFDGMRIYYLPKNRQYVFYK